MIEILDHFGNPCILCKCFVEYTDRDMPMSLKPYGIANDSYSSTEDQCLVTCLKDTVSVWNFLFWKIKLYWIYFY